MNNASDFISALRALSFKNVFNPYSDICPVWDLDDAPLIRRTNLFNGLVAARGRAKSLWVGRDLGYRGGRRTGLALTDEFNLASFAEILDLPEMPRSTKGPPIFERTAATIWEMIALLKEPIFTWNVFPLHPYVEHDPFSNRSHSSSEAKACRQFLSWLITYLEPDSVIAVGNDAHRALNKMQISSTLVRHPSYGGIADFRMQISQLYNLNLCLADRQTSLFD